MLIVKLWYLNASIWRDMNTNTKSNKRESKERGEMRGISVDRRKLREMTMSESELGRNRGCNEI